jgi:hypothetical protein
LSFEREVFKCHYLESFSRIGVFEYVSWFKIIEFLGFHDFFLAFLLPRISHIL